MGKLRNKCTALFIQPTEPGAYPPLVNAAHLMAEAGWQVTFLSAPIAGSKLKVPVMQGIDVVAMPERPSHVVSKFDYLRYSTRAMALALKIKPRVIYVSDPIGALPGVLAAKVSGARLVYHEHDSPNSEGDLNPLVRRARRAAFDIASLIVFPNAERARLAQQQSGFDVAKLRIVWNVPRLEELPDLAAKKNGPFVLYYHGSINRDRPSQTVLDAVASFNGAVRLDVAGYESPDSKGYIDELISKWNKRGVEVIRYLGEHQHRDLLQLASRCHAGLALMPLDSDNVNIRYLVGASNKAFDYMAAGLPLIVSDIPEWRETFVDAGYGKACDPLDAESVKSTLYRITQDSDTIYDMSKSCRIKIENEWNYDKHFRSVLSVIA